MWKIFSLFFCFLTMMFWGCSHPKKKEVPNQIKPQIKINYGPTQKSTLFVDQTRKMGLDHIIPTSSVLYDLDGDEYLDLIYIQNYYSRPKYALYDKTLKQFVNSGFLLKSPEQASYILIEDFDGDKVEDLILGVFNQRSEIQKKSLTFFKGLRKNSIEFRLQEDKFPSSLKAMPLGSVTPLDFDQDGDLDLFLSNWVEMKGHRPYSNYLLENKAQAKFEFYSLAQIDLARASYASSICDINNDYYPDILIANGLGEANQLLLNQKVSSKRSFIDASKDLKTQFAADLEGSPLTKQGGRTTDLKCFDYNQDGKMDVFSTEIRHSYDSVTVDGSSLLTQFKTNEVPFFYRREYLIEGAEYNWHRNDLKVDWWDYNADGLYDLIIDNSSHPPETRLLVFKQLADGSFIEEGAPLGVDISNPYNTQIYDFNFDGKMDLFTTQVNTRASDLKKRSYLYMNNDTSGHYQFYIRLAGSAGNMTAQGSRLVMTYHDGFSYRKQQIYLALQSGNMPIQKAPYASFSLTPQDRIKKIEVYWAASLKEKPKKVIYKFPKRPKAGEIITFLRNGKMIWRK